MPEPTDEQKAELLTNVIVAILDYFRSPSEATKESLGQAILVIVKED